MSCDETRNLEISGLIAGGTGSNKRAVIQRRNNEILMALKHRITSS